MGPEAEAEEEEEEEEEGEGEDGVPLSAEPLGLGGFLRAMSTTMLLMSAM